MTSPIVLFLLLFILLATFDLTNSQGVASSAVDKKVFPAPSSQPGTSGGSSEDTIQHREEPHIDPSTPGEMNTADRNRSGRSSRSVDTVLAALVDYSKDPTLWRFVHSLVDELDYSMRANQPHSTASPPHTRPVIHISRPQYYSSHNNNNNNNTSIGTNHNTQQVKGDNNNNPTATTTTTTRPLLLLPWLQQPPEEPFIAGEGGGGRGGGGGRERGRGGGGGRNQRTQQQQQQETQATATNSINNRPTPSEQHTSTTRVSFVSSTLAPPSSAHFIFHRVFLDKTFDNKTRQTYRRPILALTARDIHLATPSTDGKGNETNTTNLNAGNTAAAVTTTTTTKELEDKFDSLSAPKFESEGKVLEDEDDGGGGGGGSDVRVVLSTTKDDDGSHNHQHINKHHHHRHKQHNTFRSQLQYFQRWEERLWRRAHQNQYQTHKEHHNHHHHHHHHTTSGL